MAELLPREKEFIKLNQKLDQIATQANILVEPQQTKQPLTHQTKMVNRALVSVQHAEVKYTKQQISPNAKLNNFNNAKTDQLVSGTIHKVKVKGDIMRRRLIGDGVHEKIVTSNVMTTSPKGRDISHRANRHNGTIPMKPTSVARKYTRAAGDMNRTQIKSMKNPINTATFSVRYRNPKFVQSPSLEVLLKDECSSMNPIQFPRNCNNTAPILQKSGYTLSESGTSTKESEVTSYAGTTQSSSVSTDNKNIVNKNVSTESLVKFLKSKLVILEESHERLSKEVQQHKDLLEKALEHSRKVEQQRDQAYAKQNELMEQLTRMENELNECHRVAEEQSAQKLEQQKELENAKRDLKLSIQANQNLEKKLNRATQELNTARDSINLMKDAERELRESNRVDANAKSKQIKNLKKQRADLLNAYKKQLFLIDNLKRQNTCMEQAKLIDFCEKEFSKVLDWKEHEKQTNNM